MSTETGLQRTKYVEQFARTVIVPLAGADDTRHTGKLSRVSRLISRAPLFQRGLCGCKSHLALHSMAKNDVQSVSLRPVIDILWRASTNS